MSLKLMKCKLIFVWLYCMQAITSYGQFNTFQKMYYGNMNEVNFRNYSFIEDNNEGFLFGNYGRLVRINKFGNLEWMMNFETMTWVESFMNIVETNDNGYLASGSGVLLKLDSTYSISWIKDLSLSFNIDMGFRVIMKTLDSKFILFGHYYDSNNGLEYPALVKVDEIGNVEWAKTYVFTHSFENVGSVCVTPENGFIICGSSASLTIPLQFDIIIAKIDSLGNISWSNRYGSNAFIGGYHISLLSDSNYIITGQKNTDFYLLKVNSQGSVIWEKSYTFGINAHNLWVEETSDLGLISTGMVRDIDTAYFETPYLMKTDELGNIQWFRLYKGYIYNEPGCVHRTSDGGYAVTTVMPVPGSQGLSFGFIKTDSLGFTPGCIVESPTITVTNTSEVTIPEPVIDSLITVSFIPLAYSPPIFGTEVTYCSSIGINEISNQNNYQIYPNPCNGKFSIKKNLQYKCSIEIVDLSGKLIESFRFENENQIEIDISNRCNPGIYFVKFISKDAVQTQKIVIY